LVWCLVGAGWLGGCGADHSTPNPVAWQTATVALTAHDFWIVADGQSFTAKSDAVDVHSDLGNPTYTTLELIWNENQREMRFFIYFSADATGWWSNEMRTYNAQSPGDWLYYDGTFFGSPIGTAFQGDVDLTNASTDSLRGALHLRGLALSTTLTGG
jgi:hypothetical protein